MNIAINADSAQMGGAVTYLRNVLPALERRLDSGGQPARILVWASRQALGDAKSERVERRDPGGESGADGSSGIVRRMWFDQWELPRKLREERADALFSSANIGTLRSPVRQVLLVRNSAYFDPLLMGRIRSRRILARYAAQRALTLMSIRAADAVLFPTKAMMDLVARHTRGAKANWGVAPYGTRHDLFYPNVEDTGDQGPRVVLHVSHYCEQKDLGTLLRAMERLQARDPGRHRLRVTAGFREVEPGPLYPGLEADREVFFRLEHANIAQDMRKQDYGSLPELYRSAHVFVFPSYTESFGHPLVEAMASGLPVVAADVPVNREMCADAALYFAPFDAEACARAIARVTSDRVLARAMAAAGLKRAKQFTWEKHADALLAALGGTS